MIVGDKVVCINDQFQDWALKLYTALPKEGVTYVIRRVSIGCTFDQAGKMIEGEVCLHLVGLNNPNSLAAPFLERGFSSERFRPLDELQQRETRTQPEPVLIERREATTVTA